MERIISLVLLIATGIVVMYPFYYLIHKVEVKNDSSGQF